MFAHCAQLSYQPTLPLSPSHSDHFYFCCSDTPKMKKTQTKCSGMLKKKVYADIFFNCKIVFCFKQPSMDAKGSSANLVPNIKRIRVN